ncbi:hypothetical protein ACB094_M001300 [Castanea mollissima]
MSTLKKSDVEVADWDHEDGAGEIGARREVEEADVVVELGEARSEGGTRDVVLDETVNVDDGGGVAELNAGHEEEDNDPSLSRPKPSSSMASATLRRMRNRWTHRSEETTWPSRRRFFRARRSLGF